VVYLQQWNAHFFLLTATKLHYTDETSVFSQNDVVDEDDEDDEETEEVDNVTNAHMEVLVFISHLVRLLCGQRK